LRLRTSQRATKQSFGGGLWIGSGQFLGQFRIAEGAVQAIRAEHDPVAGSKA